jgi:hypothetical protein
VLYSASGTTYSPTSISSIATTTTTTNDNELLSIIGAY